MSNEAPCVLPNPDVSGIGVRASFYITTFLGALTLRIPETGALQSALATSAGLNGLALLITAIVKTFQKQLSLYHAIIILHILGFQGVTTNPSGNYKATSLRFVLIAFTTWCAFGAYFSWCIYIWATAPTFGGNPECNNAITYVVFFKSVRGTVGWLRWMSVAGAGAGLFALVLVPLIVFVVWICTKPSNNVGGGGNGAVDDQRDSLENDSGVIGRLLVAIYSTVMLEETVRRNKIGEVENQWSFGQFIALFVALGPVIEVFHFILALFGGNKDPRALCEHFRRFPPHWGGPMKPSIVASSWPGSEELPTQAPLVSSDLVPLSALPPLPSRPPLEHSI